MKHKEDFIEEYELLYEKMFKIFELKKKYATKVLLNLVYKDGYLTFDRQKDGKIEINLRNSLFEGKAVCGIFLDEINNPLSYFEKNLKEYQKDFLKKKKEEEVDIVKKGFTELDTIKIGNKTYPKIDIIKSTGVIDWHAYKTIKCSWKKPIEKSTADKILKLKKRDLVLSGGNMNFICHKISKIELLRTKTSTGFNVCFGMVIDFKKGEKSELPNGKE